MKFDKIIMNPPYNRNLHLKVLAEVVEHLTDDGECVNLSPITWLGKHNINRPMNKFRKIFENKIDEIEILEHKKVNELFATGNAIEDLGIYSLKNEVGNKVDLCTFGFENENELNLYRKINIIDNENIITFCQALPNEEFGTYKLTDFHKQSKKFILPIYTWHGGETCYDGVIKIGKEKITSALFFNTENEMKNFKDSLNTTFMNWYWKMFIVPGDYKIKNNMFRMADYTQPWTDERFYKFFNITLEEQKLIEETMEKYK